MICKESRTSFFIMLAMICLVSSCINTRTSKPESAEDNYMQILSSFNNWRELQYVKGVYARPGNCKLEIVTKDGYKGPDIGISGDIQVHYTDINADSKLDGLITFGLDACSGGNYLMNAQVRILVLSSGTGYRVDDKILDAIAEKQKGGLIHIEKASYGSIYGTYYEYKETDPRCCPGIRKPFVMDYATRKLSFE